MIKAIETCYKGYRFRSRLEARWAVAFDTIGHRYLYEYEGFELPSGRYLPDFYFPNLDVWGEVKPFNFTQEELQKCAELVIHTQKPCVLLVGMPEPTNYYFLFPWRDDDFYDAYPDQQLIEGVGCDDCDLWWRSERFYVGTGEANKTMTRCFIGTSEKPALAAKAARFEFGESG
jgi:hypothetical protein